MRQILFAMAVTAYESGIVEHGGGCRKSSPPGQCCHMETAAGRVHCHWPSERDAQGSRIPHIPNHSRITRFTRLLAATVVCLVFGLPAPVAGQDFLEGSQAFKEQNYSVALKEWQPLAAIGYPPAQVMLGVMYLQGLGVPQSHDEAINWFRRSAEQGNDFAQLQLGYAYDTGIGVKRDSNAARKWYALSAAQGNALAQYNLGVMYSTGNGVSQDFAEAAKWYRLAAEQSKVEAQYALGLSYALGYGVPQDYVQSHMWLNLAAAQGLEKAARDRDDIAGDYLTATDISKAQRMAREWLEKHQQ